jgi:hypothetical protein
MGVHYRRPFLAVKNERERDRRANTKRNNLKILQKTRLCLKGIPHYIARSERDNFTLDCWMRCVLEACQ